MKAKVLLVLAIVFGALFAVQQLQASQSVDVKQAQTMISQGALLLDVREPSEYAAVHVPHAKLIPLGDVNAHLKEIEAYKDKPIAVMCRSGHRSAIATAMLREAGFTQASSVDGGIQAWERAGLEVIKPR